MMSGEGDDVGRWGKEAAGKEQKGVKKCSEQTLAAGAGLEGRHSDNLTSLSLLRALRAVPTPKPPPWLFCLLGMLFPSLLTAV